MKKILIIGLIFSFISTGCIPGANLLIKNEEAISSGMRQIKKGMEWYNRGCYTQSLNQFFKAYEIFSGTDDLYGTAISLNNIGNTYRKKKELDTSYLFFKESLDIYLDMKAYKGAIQVLSNIAALQSEKNMPDEAFATLSYAEKIAAKYQIVFSPLLSVKGVLLIKEKKFAEAEKILKKALGKNRKSDKFEYATINFALGKLMFMSERYGESSKYLNKALTADKSIDYYPGIAEDLEYLGKIKIAQGITQEAINYIKRSVKVYALMSDNIKTAELILLLDNLAEKRGADISITKYFLSNWLMENSCR